MASYELACQLTGHIEAGYANDPDDDGGETVFGLTRRDWPQWKGWAVIDHLKMQYGLAKAIPIINADQELKASAGGIFKVNYWDANNLSLIDDQAIAWQAYDTDINMGVGIGARFLQECAGVPVDLKVGPKTIAAINSDEAEDFYNHFLQLRKARFDAIIAANPKKAKFKPSWYSRLKPYWK